MTTAREVALLTLDACERQGAWSDGYLKKTIRRANLDRRDAALATRICFGVLQNRMLIDYYLKGFSKIRLEKLEPKILCILRIALYQLLFLDKVPAHAAVYDAVAHAKHYSRNPRSSGLVNGILRSFLREKGNLPVVQGCDERETLSLRYSHPKWLVEYFCTELGITETEQLLQANNAQPPTTIQVNLLHTGTRALKEELEEEGIVVNAHPWLENCLLLTGSGDLEQLRAYQKGNFYVQDAASRLAVLAAGIEPGQQVLDCCGAPGGKSFAAAIQMNGKGSVIVCDIHPHKVQLIEAGRKRLGFTSMTAIEQNAREHVKDWENTFDVVLADVPCSGLGIIRKKPDIRFKDPTVLKGLPLVQSAILDNVCTYVKAGGVLLYSTCTLLKAENQNVIQMFLTEHPDFTLESFHLPGAIGQVEGMVTLWPHRHGTDGFFFAKLRRQIHD